MSFSDTENIKELQIGDIVDIFILRSNLHKGPLAHLFIAQDLLSREQVVLKVPTGDIINHPVILYHYQNEDRISRRISHTSIITYIHRQKSREYIIMAYEKGKDLRYRIRKEGSLPLSESIRIMMLLCDVISYLHGQGVIHLDLKPENIHCLEDGNIKLLDFGLASCRDLPDLLTADLEYPQGTPWYVSPEQLLGKRHHPGCDIYSMGMIFYEMVTGHLPWPRSGKLGVARRRLSHDPTPPRYYNPELPPQIQSIIMKAISRRLDHRFSSVSKMSVALQNWQNLQVTDADLTTRKPAWWRQFWPGRSIQAKKIQTESTAGKTEQEQVIGALIDLNELNDLLAEVKKQALINNWEVSLVYIIEDENDSEFLQYGFKVEGERLKSFLEKAVQLLRRFNIDPTLRLIRGDVATSLNELCSRLHARMLVMGASGTKKGKFYGESIQERLSKNHRCSIKIADKQHHDYIAALIQKPIFELTAQQVLDIDIYLIDLWYDHLHFHTDFIYQLILESGYEVDLNGHKCRLGRFLDMIRKNPDWSRIFSVLDPIHRDFHEAAHNFTIISKSDHAKMHHLYTNISLPLSCNLKGEFSHVSHMIRELVDNPPPVLPFLTDTSCPVSLPWRSYYGPILKAIDLDRDLSVLSGSYREGD